jgi:hypothetical protein
MLVDFAVEKLDVTFDDPNQPFPCSVDPVGTNFDSGSEFSREVQSYLLEFADSMVNDSGSVREANGPIGNAKMR